MFTLDDPKPVTKELIPARGDRPAVTATFNAEPSPLSLRFARRAVAEIQRDGLPNAMERAADAFSVEIVRHNLLGWTGIGMAGADDEPVEPTHDREIRDEDGKVVEVIPGTISTFVRQTRLMEAADREYVLPWSVRDAEKNGYAPSSDGTSARATRAAATASKRAGRIRKAAAKSVPTKSTRPARTRAKPSGS